MDNAATSSLSELPLEARTLMAKMTLSHREINQLLKANVKKLDVYFSLKLKNQIKEAFIEANGRIDYDNEIAFGNVLHMCTEKAYGYGYEDALKQYSAIVGREIRKAAKAFISDDINKVICSFCGKTKEEVKKIVAGSTNVFICDACAELCAQLCGGEDDIVDNDCAIGKLGILTPLEIHKKLNEYMGVFTK